MANRRTTRRGTAGKTPKVTMSQTDRALKKLARLRYDFEALFQAAKAESLDRGEELPDFTKALDKARKVRKEYLKTMRELPGGVRIVWPPPFKIPEIWPHRPILLCTQLWIPGTDSVPRIYSEDGIVRSGFDRQAKTAYAGAGSADLTGAFAQSFNRIVLGYHTQFRIPCAPATVRITSFVEVSSRWLEAISFSAGATARVRTLTHLQVAVGNQERIVIQNQGIWVDSPPGGIDHPTSGETIPSELMAEVTVNTPNALVTADEKVEVIAERFGDSTRAESVSDFGCEWLPLGVYYCCPR